MKNNKKPGSVERDGSKRPTDIPVANRLKHFRGCPAIGKSAKWVRCTCK